MGSFLITSFALGFYIMFQDQAPNKDNPFNHGSIRHTLVKTIVMTIGEIDFDDIPKTSDHKWIFQLFLVAFIFFIIVAYMNFMNGLAVQDIRLLKEESEECHYCIFD